MKDSEDEMIKCFVVGPIGDSHGDPGSERLQIYEDSIEVLEEVIQPACTALGIEAIRADQIAAPGEIPEQIFRHLRDDEIVVADLTGANPNVMYELGLRHSTGRLTVQLGERERLPFDVSAIRTILFRRTPGGLVKARRHLTEALSAGLAGDFGHASASRVWLELGEIKMSVGARDIAELEDIDVPGFLEKLADMESGVNQLGAAMTDLTEITKNIGTLTQNRASQVQRLEATGGAAGAKLEIANLLARELEESSDKMVTRVSDYIDCVERMNPGMLYVIETASKANSEETATEQKEDLSGFFLSILGFADASEEALAHVESFRDQLLSSGEATRALRKVNGKMARSLSRMLETSKAISNWKTLIRRNNLADGATPAIDPDER